MAQKVLIVDSDPESLASERSILEKEGYTVLTATDESQGLKTATAEKPHLVILDKVLPGGDGDEVVRYLRTDPETYYIPIVMTITEEQLEELLIGHESWIDDYLIKPFEPVELLAKVVSFIKGGDRKKGVISSGNGELDTKMGGGIPTGSLTLIEGGSGAGKSVLSQQIIWGSLQDGFTLSLFTSENTVKNLVKQMQSLGLDVLDFLLLGRLRVHPIEFARLGQQAPFTLLQAMKTVRGSDLLIVDSLTSAITHSSIEDVISYFEGCRRLCTRGATVIVILHSHTVSEDILVRIRSLCDAHLQLRTEQDGQKLIKTLEVTKVRGAGNITGNIVSFEVEPGWGMRVIPVSKARG